MADFIIIAILMILIGCAVFYIWKSKKSGAKCIGCPYSQSCNSHRSCNKTTSIEAQHEND